MSFAARSIGQSVKINLTNQSITDSNIGGASATYSLTAAGLVQSVTTISGTNTLELWASEGSFTSSQYEALATITSGTLTSGTVGTAVNLGSIQQWSITSAIVGTKTTIFTIVIRPAGGGTAFTTASITLNAQVA